MGIKDGKSPGLTTCAIQPGDDSRDPALPREGSEQICVRNIHQRLASASHRHELADAKTTPLCFRISHSKKTRSSEETDNGSHS
jgi:hypothetical protein